MKKHLLVILFVLALLTGVYIVGHHNLGVHKANSAPTYSSHSAAQQNPSAQKPFDKKLYSLSDPTSLWVVVNKQRPLNPISYAPTDLTGIGNGQFMRAQAATAFTGLLAGAKAAGYTLVAESGYRSYTTQQGVYANEVKAFGQAKADSESARPGYSEHQTGWAVDIGSPGCYEDCFGTMPASKWLLANAYQYGFLLRYPVDKSAITGYRNEPWHFRFIGTQLSQEMYKQQVTTLEEFFGLPAAPNYP